MRRREEHILRRALNFEVEGRRSPGRPKKTWRKVVWTCEAKRRTHPETSTEL